MRSMKCLLRLEVINTADPDALVRAAVLFGDDDILRHVHQAAGQVAGVGRAQRRVGQTLARAVGAQMKYSSASSPSRKLELNRQQG
jgi:hypothetical protein